MTKVVVFGPNLIDQSKGQFHVHAEGCGDAKHYGRDGKYGGEDRDGWTLDVETRDDVVHEVYPPDEFSYDPDTETGDYASDLWFAPCLKGFR